MKITVAQLPPGLDAIAMSPDGRLFVWLCFLGDAVFELDPAGQAPPRVITENLGSGCALNGATVGPDGRLYGAQPLRQRVVSFSSTEATAVSTVQVVTVTRAALPQARLASLWPALAWAHRLGAPTAPGSPHARALSAAGASMTHCHVAAGSLPCHGPRPLTTSHSGT
jgi:hypothetical protein